MRLLYFYAWIVTLIVCGGSICAMSAQAASCDYDQAIKLMHKKPILASKILLFLPLEEAYNVLKYCLLIEKTELPIMVMHTVRDRLNKQRELTNLQLLTDEQYFQELYEDFFNCLPLPYNVSSGGIKEFKCSWSGLKFSTLDRLRWFKHAAQINVFVLKSSELEILAPPLFDPFLVLGELDLSYNHIRKLEPGTFKNQHRLYRLLLSHNEIQYLQKNIFDGLSSLIVLEIEHNKISRIDDHVFDPIKQLLALFIDHNPLKVLSDSMLNSLERIAVIRFMYCELTEIPESFIDLILRVVSNQALGAESFFGEVADPVIDLSGNKISAQSQALLQQFQEIKFIK